MSNRRVSVNTYTQGITVKPEAYITVNKGRSKIHSGNTIFLKDQTEFQVELFNPTTAPVLAKISMNGKIISQGGLVINPGQRVFLDRYIDVAKKFKFETYEVESGSAEVQKAIANNGLIEVWFYKERQPVYIPTTYYPSYTYTYYNNNGILGSGLENGILRSSSSTANFVGKSSLTTTSFDAGTTYTGSLNLANVTNTNSVTLDAVMDMSLSEPSTKTLSKSMETGRVAEGSKSDQKFTSATGDFEFSPMVSYTYQIKPMSEMPVDGPTVMQTKNYCTNCGAKAKENFKFCPSCGQKL